MDDSRRELAFQGTESGFRVVLKRNCSIAPAALWRLFAVIALVSIGIGSGFAAFGAWMILPFAGLEVAALAVAFLIAGRHAADCERIELDRGRLRIEVEEAGRTRSIEMAPGEARIRMDGARIVVSGGAGTLELGRHLAEEARAGFGASLAKRLQQ